MKPDLLRSWATMASTPTGMKRALLVPKAAMSGEDKMALRAWRAQRQNTFQRLNDRGRLRARGWRPVYPPILSEALQAAGGFQMPRSCIIAACRSITSRLYSRCLPG
jgi:hypothetical protein